MRVPLLLHAVLSVALLTCSSVTIAKGGGAHGSHSTGTHGHHERAAPGVERDSYGHIARSERPKAEFKKLHPCPSTGKAYGACPGHVIDHVIALKRGGFDASHNMQWQTIQQAKAKDRWE
jgi:hypothetical protein